MSLELIVGCMFSGKSSELIRRLKRHKAIGNEILVINSAKDVRNSSNVLQTHDGVTFDCVKTNDLMTLNNHPKFQQADIIGIDESQFFSHLKNFVKYSLEKNKKIIVAGLDGDFQQNIFGDIISLVPLADKIDKLHALCMECRDGTLASFSKRIVNSNNQEMIGDCDIYKAVCRHHLKN